MEFNHKSLLNEKLSFYLRCCILGCYPSEDYFLEKEGIFLLLDLLAVSMIITIIKQ